MAIRLLHVRSFPTIPGSKESAHNWARTATVLQMPGLWRYSRLGSRELGVAIAHLQFPTLARAAALTGTGPRPLCVISIEIDSVRCCASESNRLSRREVWG